jgi:VIT1/CCC1 family predicted Fe2+/Mn2+ transporter
MANEIEIPLKLSGVTSLKAELRQLKAAIADASDPEQMAALAARAGEVADRIKDANDAVNVFASGSKFEQISNSFGGIRDSIMSLDFEEASQKAQVFAKNLGGLNAADISKSMKGLTSTITTMGGAFLKLGAQILTNPIFLLTAIITAIVVAIGVFLNKIGVLQKVLDFLMIPINALIDGFKELTDWLGLTSYAAEENARTMEKANEKAFKSSEKRTEAISDQYDLEIAKAKAAGKDTTKLEMEKSKAITDAAKKRLSDARNEYAELKGLTDKDSIDRRKALRKRIEEENKLIKDGSKERKMIKIADDAEQKAADDKAAEEAKQKREERLKKYKEGEAAILAEIKSANKLVVDSTKTQSQKEIDDIKTKYAALIEEAKKYKKDITALEQAQSLEINNVRKAEAAETEMIQTKSAKSAISTLVSTRTQQLQIQGEANMVSFEEQQKYNAAVEAAEQSLFDARLGMAKGLISAIGDLAGENKKVANALFVVDKALAIGEVVVNTQREISGYLSNPTWTLLPDGGAALKTAAVAGAKIRAATSIGTIVASSISKFMNGGGGASVSAPSSAGVSGGSQGGGTAVPSFVPGNLFGQGNAANNTGSASGVETNSTITVNAVVSETEMTGVQNKVNKILKNAVL